MKGLWAVFIATILVGVFRESAPLFLFVRVGSSHIEGT